MSVFTEDHLAHVVIQQGRGQGDPSIRCCVKVHVSYRVVLLCHHLCSNEVRWLQTNHLSTNLRRVKQWKHHMCMFSAH